MFSSQNQRVMNERITGMSGILMTNLQRIAALTYKMVDVLRRLDPIDVRLGTADGLFDDNGGATAGAETVTANLAENAPLFVEHPKLPEPTS